MQDGKHVILVIDDDSDFIFSTKVVLEANNYIVASAASAEEGLEVYKQSAPDLVILDLMMEEIDAGTKFIKDLQALGNTAPICMLSSLGDTLAESIDTSELGLAAVFQKPIDIDVMLKTLKARLA